MGNVAPAVEWYRRRIHQKQRRATELSIEVGLNAQEEEDTEALVETIECLETAIGILEQAKATGIVALAPLQRLSGGSRSRRASRRCRRPSGRSCSASMAQSTGLQGRRYSRNAAALAAAPRARPRSPAVIACSRAM